MRREYLTHAELMAHLRMEGLEGPEAVKSARVESDGRISVVKRD
ncbi:MAG: YetF domain-containing protein [Cypionkella sp.]